MTKDNSVLDIVDATIARRNARRAFIKAAAGGAAAVGGLSLLAACGDDGAQSTPFPTPTPTPAASVSTDVAVLNFALNLEYLEAQFYSYAAFGTGLSPAILTGTGTQGSVVTGSGAGFPRAVDFSGDPLIGQYAREIAGDESAHVNFLRNALGSAAVAQPAIDISGTSTGAFTLAARAAGVIGANDTFDPYASPTNFLLAAYIFEDIGVTAYKGASPVISAMYLDAAAGILAAEAYHAGLVRTILYARGVTNADLITNAQKISNLRDAADGTASGSLAGGTTPTAGSASPDGTTASAGDDDQGVGGTNIGNLATGVSNIVPADVNGLAYSRTSQQVHNIAYLNATGANRTRGGFFPAGTNNPNPAFTVGLG
ncbi:MAG: ferritin-like domain-containing protein [Sphingomonas sp.]